MSHELNCSILILNWNIGLITKHSPISSHLKPNYNTVYSWTTALWKKKNWTSGRNKTEKSSSWNLPRYRVYRWITSYQVSYRQTNGQMESSYDALIVSHGSVNWWYSQSYFPVCSDTPCIHHGLIAFRSDLVW